MLPEENKRMKELVSSLNKYRYQYYNENNSEVSDKDYDVLFDELKNLENKTGTILNNSPTVTVGYEVVSDLNKVQHEYPPMLSLDKTKSYGDIKKFLSNQPGVVMAKMDGLTCRLTYVNGELVRAETRGNGIVGEDITHNIKFVKDVPLCINKSGKVLVDGELIIRNNNFEILKEKFVDSKGKKYKNSRNLASGSARLHDSSKCAERMLEFVAWKLIEESNIESFTESLNHLNSIGFNVVPHISIPTRSSEQVYEEAVILISNKCNKEYYPIDGCVFSYDNLSYMRALEYTSHHWKAQIAFKFKDDLYDTVIREIDWTMGKTGSLCPTAVFDTVEIDGTDVSRASLHNLTILKEMNVRKNCSARVFKANMIIPQVYEVDNDGTEDFIVPNVCPVCGGRTSRVKENDSEVLMCTNPDCTGKLLGKLCTFVSKQGMDIDGLGESNLDLFIQLGLVTSFVDIYRLKNHKEFLKTLEGKGDTSIDKMLSSIESSKDVTFENFIASLSIPNIGLTTAKTIGKYFNNNIHDFKYAFESNFDFSNIEGIGEKTASGITKWLNDNWTQFDELLNIVRIREMVSNSVITTESPISGKTFCITGTFIEKRSELQKKIESLGAKFVDSVTKKTDVLFVGSAAGSKLKKAENLGIKIFNEEETYQMLKEYNLL